VNPRRFEAQVSVPVHTPLVEVEKQVEMKIDDVAVNASDPSIELLERRCRHSAIIANASTDEGVTGNSRLLLARRGLRRDSRVMDTSAQPTGTVTLVFTDIEGSTRLLIELGEVGYREALARHREVVREAFGRHGGYEVDTQGDSFFYAFASAIGAVRAVEEAMGALEGGPIALRVGVHTGEPTLDPPAYLGIAVHTAARIMAAGHGGQVVLSRTTRELLDESFPLLNLGEHRLKDLSAPLRLYQLGGGGFPPLRTLHRTNLPVPATSFIGRGCELDELGVLLRHGVPLLVLTGPGGVGKTRLAMQAAAEAADAFPDGIWWVPLASVRDPTLVLPSVALALGVPEQSGRALEKTLVDVLSGGRAILVLDNLEHLLPGAAASVAMLRDAVGATLVVTSRARLRISGEHVYAVAPLAPTEAAELFAARTTAIGVDPGEARAVAELCARLDNLPLAVELAAARASLLAPGEILSRLGGRLDRLKGGRDADPRQQTLRDTIAWSHDLLDERERELFACLAVFAGGGTLEAVEAVCDADLDVLDSLLDKSLVRRSGGRIGMLETIREFASEQLGGHPGADEVRDRHAGYYVALAEAADGELTGPGQPAALERLASERDNLHAAIEQQLERDPSAALALVAALWRSWAPRGQWREGREMLLAALQRAGPEPTEARASALVGAGLLASYLGDQTASVELLEEGLTCARETGTTLIETFALSFLSLNAERGREELIRLGEEAMVRAEANGDPWLCAWAMGNHGVLLSRFGETEQATHLWEEEYRLCRGTNAQPSMMAVCLKNLGDSALWAGDTVKARARLDESLEFARLIDEARIVGSATAGLGWVELLEGRLGRARSCFEDVAVIARALGSRKLAVEALSGFANVTAARGDADRAARLAGAASAVGGSAEVNQSGTASHIADARAALGEDAWEKAWADGAELDLDAALRLARDR
jgi:predicted ATPase/class 3 adenylate cyclase